MCYLGKVNRFDRDDQLKLCEAIVEKLGLAPLDGRVYEHNELDSFTRELRGNEAAIVPLLAALADKKGSGTGVNFFMRERHVHDNCEYIVSIDTTKPRALADLLTVQSDAGRDWYKLLQKTGGSVMRGRALKTKDAKKKARKRHAKPGLVQTWQLKEGTAEYLVHAQVWGNLGIKPAEKAIGMFPDDELRKASPATINRIFGTRQQCCDWLNDL